MRFRRDSRQRLSSVYASGHTGFADYGEDIVCAAASAILQSAWLGLTDYAKIEVRADRAEGHLALHWPEAARDDLALRAILGSAELAINQMALQFPANLRTVAEIEPEAN